MPSPTTSDGGGAAWVPSYPRLRRLDEKWYLVERALCSVMFLVMALLAFSQLLAEAFVNRHRWSDVVILAGVVLLGVRTRAVAPGKAKPSWPLSIGLAIGIAAAVATAVYYFATTFAGKLIWTDSLALILMLWVALLGSSVATYERSHLALEFGEALWPARLRHWIKALAHGVTAAFCVFAVYITYKSLMDEMTLGRVSGVDAIPMWVVYLIFPYAFIAMAVRYLAQAVTTATKTEEPIEERLPS